LTKILGEEAQKYDDYIDNCFADDENTLGCYVGLNPVGVWQKVGAVWNKKIGEIYLAGTETSEIWNGYMEGAILSGEKIANEILSN
jgi:monoamine oxidase